MANYLESESESIQYSREVVGVVDEKDRLLDLLFVAEFTQEQPGEMHLSRLKWREMEELVRLGINRGVQSVAFIVALNHRLIECDAIRLNSAVGL